MIWIQDNLVLVNQRHKKTPDNNSSQESGPEVGRGRLLNYVSLNNFILQLGNMFFTNVFCTPFIWNISFSLNAAHSFFFLWFLFVWLANGDLTISGTISAEAPAGFVIPKGSCITITLIDASIMDVKAFRLSTLKVNVDQSRLDKGIR